MGEFANDRAHHSTGRLVYKIEVEWRLGQGERGELLRANAGSRDGLGNGIEMV